MVKEGYRNTSIGVIPDDWKVERLSDVGEVTGGNTPRRSTDEYWGGDIPWLTPSQLTGKLINEISETDEYITEKGFENSSVKLLPPGTVIMSSRATIGETVINKVPMTTNQGFANIICDENKVFNYYLLYLLRYITPRLKALAGGSTFLEISRTNVRSVNIPVPPLPEQKKISSILSSVDESIEKTDEVIKETKELKKGLMQELFTRGVSGNDLRLSPHENNDLYKNSYLGFVPEDWIDYQISDIAETDYGLNSAIDKTLSKGIKMISVGNVNKDGTLDFDDVNYAIEDKISSEDILLKGDILFNWRNGSKEHLGKTIYFDLNDEFTHVGLLIRIRTNKNENIYSKFLYYFMRYIHFKQFFTRAKKQVNNTFNKTELNNLQVFIPPLEEQKKIASILSSVDTKIKKEEEYKAKLEQLKKGLMQKLLTGEIRVNTEMEV